MDVFYQLYRHLDERRETLSDFVTSGGAKSYDEYRQHIGALREIEMMTQAIRELEKKHIDAD
jgi:hypothetical protein